MTVSRETYYKTIKAVLMGCGEDEQDAIVMAKTILLDEDLTSREALALAEAYAESKGGKRVD